MTADVLPLRANRVSTHATGMGRQRRLAAYAALLVTVVLFAALMVGDRPFAVDAADKAELARTGSVFNRSVILLCFMASLLVALVYAGRVSRLMIRSWPVLLLVIWSAASVAWAAHPDLAARRAIAFSLVYLVLLIVAAAARSVREGVWCLVGVLTAVTVLNVVAWQFVPAASWSEIGETGIFDNKNSAGTAAMLAAVTMSGAIFLSRRVAPRLMLAGLGALAWAFLFATRSKTSMGLAALAMCLGPLIYLVLGSRPASRWIVVLAGCTVGLFLVVGLSGAGYEESDARLILFGDVTFTGRTELWDHLLAEIGRRPWIGYGSGSFWDIGATVNPIASAHPSAWFMNAQLINTAHNGYLDVWLQTGLVGFALAVLVVGWTLIRLLIEAAACRSGERVALVLAMCLALCLALNNLLESYLFRSGDVFGYLFVFLFFHAESARMRRRSTVLARSA